jgi:hypothetical protein
MAARGPAQGGNGRAAPADVADARDVLAAEQRAAHEARYAAKKAAKKRRQRGY